MASRLIDDLVERRVPQYLAVYLGGSWAIVEFFAFLEERFLLSPHLTNLIMVLLALLFPSVALFTYFHGRRGADRWRRVEKVFIPANILLLVFVLFTGFSGKELGAVTTTVTVEDEEGNDVERVLPKAEFRKRLALFPPRAAAPEDEWLGAAVVYGLLTDLYQDQFLDLRPHMLFKERFKQGGLRAQRAPQALKREIAGEHYLGYFVDGAVARTDGGYRLELALHDVDGGGVVAQHTLEAADFFALIDSASVRLRRDLELPARHLAENPDLSVADMETESVEAYRLYVTALERFMYDDDYAGASADLRAALEADPTFAAAAFALYQMDMVQGQTETARGALQRTLDHLYRLPERQQFRVKAEWYALQQDFTKAFSVYEMWAELYPQDIDAQLAAAEGRQYNNDRRGAIEKLEQVLRLDPTRDELLVRIADHYRRLGELEDAERYYVRYVERSRERPESHQALAELRQLQGRHEDARESLERALLLDPGNADVLLALADLDRDIGEWDAAEARYAEALAAARTPMEKQRVLFSSFEYHRGRRDFGRAADELERALEQARLALPPVITLQYELLHLGDRVRAGRADQARATMAAMDEQLSGPSRMVLPLGRLSLYGALEEPEPLAAAVREAEAMVEASGFGALEVPVLRGRGELHELRKEWREALATYERLRESSADSPEVPVRLGRVERELGNLDRARTLLEEALSVLPASGRANYELGRVYEALEQPDRAIRHYERAAESWAPAPDTDALARDARARLEAVRQRLTPVRPGG